MAYSGFESTTIANSFSAGYPFGYRNGNLTEYSLTIDNLNTEGVEDFGIVRSAEGYNLHSGVVPFANGTNSVSGTSALRLTPYSASQPFELVSIKLDTLVTGTGGTVTFTGLKADGVTTVSHVVTLDNARSLETFLLPQSFDNLIQLDIEGPANFQFDDVDVKISVIGTSGMDLIVLGVGSWFVDGGGSNDDIYWPKDTFGGETFVNGGGGNDYIEILGGSFDNDDFVDGGAGIDELVFRGTPILGAVGNMTNIETIYLVSGGITSISTFSGLSAPGPSTRNFADTGYQYDYTIIAVDAFLPAGQQRTIMATGLGSSEGLIFAASAETDGQYIIRSGAGRDILVGGALNDQLFGGAGHDTLVGGAGTDILRGESGNDYLDGGAGADDMLGSLGDDIYVIDSMLDTLSELAGEGTDTIHTTFTYTIIANFENLTAIGNAAIDLTGDGLPNVLVGNGAANTLNGLGGNDTLIGGGGGDTLRGEEGNDFMDGGAGTDILVGGIGDDLYIVNSETDVVTELAGEGNDRVAAIGSYALAAGVSVETLEAITLSATDAFNLAGNELSQKITGNNGNNTLTSGGGTDTMAGAGGNDTLIGNSGAASTMNGNLGNDVFFVRHASDVVVEAAGEGNDRVVASVSYVLTGGSSVETLETISLSSTTPLNLTGNALNQTIIGNSGNNILQGGGGNDYLIGAGGNDTMIGGSSASTMEGGPGDDVYFVSDGSDLVIELSGGGNDRIAASTSHTLAPGAEVETLEAAVLSSTTSLNFTGNVFQNLLIGNNGDNVLDGKGGIDVLNGAGGADTFAFTTALAANNIDTILGFLSGTDRIGLDDAIFTAIAPSALTAGAFFIGSQAADADDRVIYNPSTGALFYDPDGTGGAAQMQFATLSGGPTLVGSDFVLI